MRSRKPGITKVGVHKSTVSRELRRNKGLKGYRPKQANHLAIVRQLNKLVPRIREGHWLEIERLLKLYRSPEQIAWRLYEEQRYMISHEWIYQYIYKDQQQGGKLYRYLRCQKKRKKRYGSNDRRVQIPNQRMIDERPPEAFQYNTDFLFSRIMAPGGSTDISNGFSALRLFVIIVSSSG
jgi:IS30 family transposase